LARRRGCCWCGGDDGDGAGGEEREDLVSHRVIISLSNLDASDSWGKSGVAPEGCACVGRGK
jgi:hypothetical protein